MDETWVHSLLRRSNSHTNRLKVKNLIKIKILGTTKPSNSKRIQSLQSKIIRKIAIAPFFSYVCNRLLHKDLNVPFVSNLATSRYKTFHFSILNRDNPLVQALTSANLPQSPPRRLDRRQRPTDSCDLRVC
jgi:hypothetical protein